MAVSVKIDQAGAPAGVAGQAREDLETGVSVTLAAVGGPYLAYQWSIRDKALDILTATESTASLSAPTGSTTSLSPIDVAGGYAGRLIVDSGAGLGASPEDVFDWSFYAGDAGDPLFGPPGADADDLPRREPTFGETTEHNAPDAVEPTGNTKGWQRELKRWFAVVRRLYRRQLFAVGVISLPAGGPAALGRELGLAGATRDAEGVVTVTFDAAFPDGDYAAFALPIGPDGGSAVVSSRATGSCVVERGDLGGSLVDADFVLVCALRF